MKVLNSSAIEMLRNGEIAVMNNGDIQSLREVLKAAFPKQTVPANGVNHFYMMDYKHINDWKSFNHISNISVPIFPIEHFYSEDKSDPEVKITFITESGQEVLLSKKDIRCISQFKNIK
jgi:hypothetical protein